MRLSIPQSQLRSNPLQILRRAGYAYIRSRKTGQESFVRRLGAGFYPRLHLYVEEQGGTVNFNLHLDQKEASYAGSHAHNADYDGPVVSGEIERLKAIIFGSAGLGAQDLFGSGAMPKKPAPAREAQEEKGFWRKLFG